MTKNRWIIQNIDTDYTIIHLFHEIINIQIVIDFDRFIEKTSFVMDVVWKYYIEIPLLSHGIDVRTYFYNEYFILFLSHLRMAFEEY